MSEKPKMFIAGIGMVTPVGINTAMTAAAVRAGVSAYEASSNFTQLAEPITMTRIPPEVFTSIDIVIDEGSYNNHIIKMAILALREAVATQTIKKPIPLILAMPEDHPDNTYIEPEVLIENLVNQKDLPLHADLVRTIPAGRAAGIQGLELAFHFLNHQRVDFVLLGGSDSYWVYPRLGELDLAGRLLAPNNMDGFAAGEGAGFLLLTLHPQRALVKNNSIVALYQPGNSQELGHLYSDEPYRGDGLDQAFKQALNDYTGNSIRAIYSSMNGEQYWAKEYGVAYIRNKEKFHDQVKVEHPSDCFGDLGAACAPVLMGLAAENLWKQPGQATNLIYSSSDSAARGAVRVEKFPRPVTA